VTRQRGQLLRKCGSGQLAMWGQRCEKTARLALKVVRQKAASSLCSEV
jgi:hypothetical protein